MANDRWQYEVQTIKSNSFFTQRVPPEALQKLLNERGTLGWELVQILPPSAHKLGDLYTLVFKRQN